MLKHILRAAFTLYVLYLSHMDTQSWPTTVVLFIVLVHSEVLTVMLCFISTQVDYVKKLLEDVGK